MDGYELRHSYKPDPAKNVIEQQRLLIHQGTRWMRVKELADSIFGKVILYSEAKFNNELKKYEQVFVDKGSLPKVTTSNENINDNEIKVKDSNSDDKKNETNVSDVNNNDKEPNLFVVKKSEKRYADNGLSTTQCPVLENVVEEVRILKNLSIDRCDNVIELVRSFSDQYNYFTVFPYYNAGELYDYIVKKKLKYLDEVEAASIFRDIVNGVIHIHKNNVAHLDISPENIMLHRLPDGKLRAVIIDFGLARTFSSASDKIKLSSSVGKARYMSPEMYTVSKTRIIDAKPCDIWTLGTTLFVMLFGVPMYDEPIDSCAAYTLMATHRKFKEVLTAWEFKPSDIALDILQKILVVDPNNRPKATEILDHKFFGPSPSETKDKLATAETTIKLADKEAEAT